MFSVITSLPFIFHIYTQNHCNIGSCLFFATMAANNKDGDWQQIGNLITSRNESFEITMLPDYDARCYDI